VGAAVSGASKVAGAVASTAVTGAKHFLAGLIPKPAGKVGPVVGPAGVIMSCVGGLVFAVLMAGLTELIACQSIGCVTSP